MPVRLTVTVTGRDADTDADADTGPEPDLNRGPIDICRDGEIIGHIQGRPNHIQQFDILPTYRGNGYAKSALNRFVTRAEQQGVEAITTGAVVSPAMGWVLRCPDTPAFEQFNQTQDDGIRYRVTL